MSARTAALLALLLAVAGACDDSQSSAGGKVTGDLSVYDLKTGDCFNRGEKVTQPTGSEALLEMVASIPCDQEHDHEVFAVFEHELAPGFVFPGGAEVTKVAQGGCLDRFEGYVGGKYEDSKLLISVIAPGERSWMEENDRSIACIVSGEDTTLKKSVKNSGE